MAKEQETTTTLKVAQVPETWRQTIVNDADEETSLLEVLAELRNDVKELKRKLL